MTMTESKLHNYFQKFGRVAAVYRNLVPGTKFCQGSGCVTFEDEVGAMQALAVTDHPIDEISVVKVKPFWSS